MALDGEYAFGEVVESVCCALTDPGFVAGASLLFDERLSRANPSSAETRDWVQSIASLRTKGIAARCAIVVGAEAYRYGLARMAAIYFELAGMQARIFSDVEGASRWLSGTGAVEDGGTISAIASRRC